MESQVKYFSDPVCVEILGDCERRYPFRDESALFSGLVNFSTAGQEPYQRWVRYREGYSTRLVEELIRRAGTDRDRFYLADPMMGSGTTLLAGARAGYDCLGTDVNPYCKIIADLKLARPSRQTLRETECLLDRLTAMKPEEGSLERAAAEIRKAQKARPGRKDGGSDAGIRPLAHYFPLENLRWLLMAGDAIGQMEPSTARDILRGAWLFSLESCSNRRKDGNGLSTRPSPVKDPAACYGAVVRMMVEDYSRSPVPEGHYTGLDSSAADFAAHARRFRQENGKGLGLVIFSPPYANSFDYFESYKLELLFGGILSEEAFFQRKKELIRNYRICCRQELDSGLPLVEGLCRELWQAIPRKEARTGRRDSRTRLMPNMLRGYFTDMKGVLEQLFQALDRDGICYIVVDQSAYAGVIIPTDLVLAHLAEEAGFTVSGIIKCRQAVTSVQQRTAFPYLKTALRESIIELRR